MLNRTRQKTGQSIKTNAFRTSLSENLVILHIKLQKFISFLIISSIKPTPGMRPKIDPSKVSSNAEPLMWTAKTKKKQKMMKMNTEENESFLPSIDSAANRRSHHVDSVKNEEGKKNHFSKGSVSNSETPLLKKKVLLTKEEKENIKSPQYYNQKLSQNLGQRNITRKRADKSDMKVRQKNNFDQDQSYESSSFHRPKKIETSASSLSRNYETKNQFRMKKVNQMSEQIDEETEQNSSYYFELSTNPKEKLQWIRGNIIGLDSRYVSQASIELEAVYIDHTATNRPFKAIQKMVDYSKMYSANPHTEFSHYGKYSTNLLKYSEKSLLRSFNGEKNYIALPVGSGCTGAIDKTIRILTNIQQIKQRQTNKKKISTSIFITPYEHHSNILPWVEFYGHPEVLSHDHEFTLNKNQISEQILKCRSDQIIISISATSNVTSKLTDLPMMNEIVKEKRKQGKNIYFGLDCAAYCCHHQLNLKTLDQVDFAFISPHKNLGGIETTGVLVARKSIMEFLDTPTFPGGGTVSYVKGYGQEDISYDSSAFNRQVSGTPNHLGFYRAALSFELLTNIISYEFINTRQKKNTEKFFSMIAKANQSMKSQGIDTKIVIYGSHDLESRANVVTFNFQYGEKGCVPHSLAGLLYTDFFGIQIRSGCFCAGPFGVNLLKVSEKTISRIQEEISVGIFINKPGYLRIDLTFYLEDYEVEYIVKATVMIAKYWRNLEKFYTLCKDGEVKILPVFERRQPVEKYSFKNFLEISDKLSEMNELSRQETRSRKQRLDEQIQTASEICKDPIKYIQKEKKSLGKTGRKR